MYDLTLIQKLRKHQTVFIISSTKKNLFLNEFMFNLLIVLFALSNLCFFILMMSLEETLPPITEAELSLTLSSYFCQSKFVRKALKFLKSTEIPASFRCNLLLSVFLDLYYCE